MPVKHAHQGSIIKCLYEMTYPGGRALTRSSARPMVILRLAARFTPQQHHSSSSCWSAIAVD
jgi:hypothetical protein